MANTTAAQIGQTAIFPWRGVELALSAARQTGQIVEAARYLRPDRQSRGGRAMAAAGCRSDLGAENGRQQGYAYFRGLPRAASPRPEGKGDARGGPERQRFTG